MAPFLLAFLTYSVLSAFGASPRKNLSIIIQDDGTLKVSETLNPSADVEAYFIDAMNETGWGTLEVKINVIKRSYPVSDSQRMFAAGAAEGYLTSLGIHQIYQNILNTSIWDFTNGPPDNLKKFISDQQDYMMKMVSQNKDDPFWQYADLLNYQLGGLQYGYNLTAPSNNIPTHSDSWPFVFLNLVGDLLDLMSALSYTLYPRTTTVC